MIQNYIIYKVLMEFFDSPTKRFQLREISRRVKLGLPSVINHVNALKKGGFVRQVSIGIHKFYIANKEDPKYKLYKKLDMIRRVNESGLLDCLEKRLSYPSAVILFGSAAYGEDIEKSDIDIAILAKETSLGLQKYENALKRKIQLHFFKDTSEMEKNRELFNNIINGVILYGFVKVV